jgi:acyl-CoA synthetase (NDP forming)
MTAQTAFPAAPAVAAARAATAAPRPAHRLDPLLRPRSLAIVGASARPGSVGNTMVRQVLAGGYGGRLWCVNPKGEPIEGVPCVPSVADLPEPVEHVALALADERIEETLALAIRRGVRAATLISPLAIPGDRDPPLKERVRAMALEAGVTLCGGNGMGFYNFRDGLWLCGFPTRPDHRPGGAVLLTHSGSLFTALVDAEARLDYGLAVSSGQELTTTLSDYMDFALETPETRVIGLFMETARDPAGFEAALARANAKGVPVVALKVGRTAASVRLAESHSGAIAGDHAAYSALFRRYGVAEVRAIDELAAALMVLGRARDIGPGGLATTHDSGGERGLMVDLADDHRVSFARLSPETERAMAAVLDHGLEPVNPLDHWGSGRNYPADFRDSFRLMMDDPGTALGALVLDRWVGGQIMPHYRTVALDVQAATGKPVFIVSNHQGSCGDDTAVETTRAGVPVLDGVPAFLTAVRLALAWRNFKAAPAGVVEGVDADVVAKWRDVLGTPAAARHSATLPPRGGGKGGGAPRQALSGHLPFEGEGRLQSGREGVTARERDGQTALHGRGTAEGHTTDEFAAAPPPYPPPRGGRVSAENDEPSTFRLDEATALALLADFGLPVVPHALAESEDEAVAAAVRLGFPIVLKTATPGIAHKSDVGGVILKLAGEDAVRLAYRDLSSRLGPRVLVAAMVTGRAVEMMFGMTRDPDFGPIVLVGFGGIHAEVLKDAAVAKPPFDAVEARRLIDGLRLRPLLDGVRGAPAADIDGLAAAFTRFSALAAAVGDLVEAIDVNPVLVRPDDVVAVDALIVPRRD